VNNLTNRHFAEEEKMTSLTDLEQKIVNSAQYYQSKQPFKWKGNTDKFEIWYELAYKNFMEQIWPKIKSNNELLVNYWPTYFVWGTSSNHRRTAFENRYYLHKKGTFGTGFLCLTLSNLYIVSLKKVTERFPLYDRGMKGFLREVLVDRTMGEVDDRLPLNENRQYIIPVQSVLDAQIIQDQDSCDVIALQTTNDQILIHNHFTGQLEEIALALRMVHTAKLTQVLGLELKSQTELSNSSDIGSPLEKLKQLKQMLDAGLINNKEYETKKTDILSRM